VRSRQIVCSLIAAMPVRSWLASSRQNAGPPRRECPGVASWRRAGGLRSSRRSLGERLDVFLVRKLGVPGREESAVGAIASGGVAVVNDRSSKGRPSRLRPSSERPSRRAGNCRAVSRRTARAGLSRTLQARSRLLSMMGRLRVRACEPDGSAPESAARARRCCGASGATVDVPGAGSPSGRGAVRDDPVAVLRYRSRRLGRSSSAQPATTAVTSRSVCASAAMPASSSSARSRW
jgi:hypothetical protein